MSLHYLEKMISDDSDVEFEDILENENQEFIPEESVDYDETKKIMQGILDQLPDEQRLCVLMYYYDELSVKEIAETLGCSTRTVKSRLNYARKYIKKECEKQEKKGTKLYSMHQFHFLYGCCIVRRIQFRQKLQNRQCGKQCKQRQEC